jgi:hypothetical protein
MPQVFLLSPAYTGGVRAKLLMRPEAGFELAVRLRNGGATLGEVCAFMSGLYFRGKLAYARAFAAPPEGLSGSYVITSGFGLLPPDTHVTISQLQQIASVPIDAGDPRYREPLEQACRRLHQTCPPDCDFVLLGSVATLKYLEPLSCTLGDRLLFPSDFVGRGDMSRGGLLLRSVESQSQLPYVPVGTQTHHGTRPPKLPKPLRMKTSG